MKKGIVALLLVMSINGFGNKLIKMETAVFGAGCFWCVEAIYQQIDGVSNVESGYMGGAIANPTYREVCSGKTGHAEVIKINYDPTKVSYVQLLEVFFKTHDPTTLNRQGADAGTQYRSVIYYYSDKQKNEAETVFKAIDKAKIYTNPLVTEISKASVYYKAEEYHQNYYSQNKEQSYCRAVITPKVEKFNKLFADLKRKD